MGKTDYQNLSLQAPANRLLGLPFYYVPAKFPEAGHEWAKWHEELEIKFILRGTAEVTCGPNVFLAREGDTVVINSCQLHSIRSVGDEPVLYDLLMVSPQMLYTSALSGLLTPLREGTVSIQNLVRGDETVRAVGQRLFHALSGKKHAYELEAVGYFSLLMAQLLRCHRQTVIQQEYTPDVQKYLTRLRPAVAYIQQNYRSDFKNEVLAAACGLSMFHFCRLFRQVTGYTVVSYINQFRCQKAKLLLKTTELSVSEVSDAVGFSDPAYFSRCFRKAEGISPAQYRKTAK